MQKGLNKSEIDLNAFLFNFPSMKMMRFLFLNYEINFHHLQIRDLKIEEANIFSPKLKRRN